MGVLKLVCLALPLLRFRQLREGPELRADPGHLPRIDRLDDLQRELPRTVRGGQVTRGPVHVTEPVQGVRLAVPVTEPARQRERPLAALDGRPEVASPLVYEAQTVQRVGLSEGVAEVLLQGQRPGAVA